MSYPVIDVSHWEVLEEEHPGYIGERDKEWLRDPDSGQMAMFKIPRKNRGEHWAEKLCCELALILKFPNAKVELAVRDGVDGCLSYFFVDKDNGYSHYDSGSFFQYSYDIDHKIDYKIEIIEEFLNEFHLFDNFLSIVLFDALVANGDRHQDNWGITRHEKTGKVSISPMYDNSACLGRDFSQNSIQKYLSSDLELIRHLFKGKSKIGINNNKNANHFYLIRYLCKRYPNRMKELIDSIAGLKDDDIENTVNKLSDTVLDCEYKKVVVNFIKIRKVILLNIGENMKNNINEIQLVWKDPETRHRFIVGNLYYNEEKDEYMFSYKDADLNSAVDRGFKNYPSFPDLNKDYVNVGGLFPGIYQRLPNRKRSNYPEILMKYNLDATSSEMEILAATRGRLGTDNFEFVQAINFISEEHFKVTFDLAAARRYDFPKVRANLSVNQEVTLVHHKENEVDKFAIKVMYDKEFCLGFVPKYYSREIFKMLESRVNYTAKINKLDVMNKNPDEWANIIVEVVYQ